LQNSPLESSCVVVALTENYSTSKPSKGSPEKSQILISDTVDANERYFVLSSIIPKNCIFYEIMWENMVEQGRPLVEI